MTSRDFIPAMPLRAFIKLIRIRHFLIKGDASSNCKPFPPRPEQCLIFYPAGHEIVEDTVTGRKWVRKGVTLAGQYTHRLNRYLEAGEFIMVEVDLQPGALHRLTCIPFHELVNMDIDAETVFPLSLKRLSGRLSATRSYGEMVSLVEAFFFELSGHVKTGLSAVDHHLIDLSRSYQAISLDELARRSYLSPRQLERRFNDLVGVGPKAFLRICRFNLSYWMHLNDPSLHWLAIAVECGYSDYQHLAKDYKSFANTTPVHFFSEESKAPGRVLGLTR